MSNIKLFKNIYIKYKFQFNTSKSALIGSTAKFASVLFSNPQTCHITNKYTASISLIIHFQKIIIIKILINTLSTLGRLRAETAAVSHPSVDKTN